MDSGIDSKPLVVITRGRFTGYSRRGGGGGLQYNKVYQNPDNPASHNFVASGTI